MFRLFLWITSQFHHGIPEPPTKINLCHCQFVLMSLNIHFFLGPLPIGTPSHWLFVSCSRLSASTGLCRTRHPPTIVDYHDTPAVTGGLHPLLDIAPKNEDQQDWLTWWRTRCVRWRWDASAGCWRLPHEMSLSSRCGRTCLGPRRSAHLPRPGAPAQ